jgi:hypothetical protein
MSGSTCLAVCQLEWCAHAVCAAAGPLPADGPGPCQRGSTALGSAVWQAVVTQPVCRGLLWPLSSGSSFVGIWPCACQRQARHRPLSAGLMQKPVRLVHAYTVCTHAIEHRHACMCCLGLLKAVCRSNQSQHLWHQRTLYLFCYCSHGQCCMAGCGSLRRHQLLQAL